MNKSDLIIKLMEEKGWTLAEAKEFVADMPDEPTTPSGRPRQQWEAGDVAQVRGGNDKVAPRFIVAQRGANGLTARQQAGVDRGQSLCPNCQNPEDDHTSGCLRDPRNGFTERERGRALTKVQLPPTS